MTVYKHTPSLAKGPCERGLPKERLLKVSDLQGDDEMEKRVTRKLHMHIMSRFCLLTILNHMDRANLVKPRSVKWLYRLHASLFVSSRRRQTLALASRDASHCLVKATEKCPLLHLLYHSKSH